jgi:hypothetical protein
MIAKSPGERFQVPAEIAEVLTPYVPAAMLAKLIQKDTAALAAAVAGPYPGGLPAAVPVASLVSPAPSAQQPEDEQTTGEGNRTVLYALLGAGIVLLLVLIVVVIKLAFFSPARASAMQAGHVAASGHLLGSSIARCSAPIC